MPAGREDIPLEGSVFQNIVTFHSLHNENYENDAGSVRIMCKRGLSETSTTSAHSYINYRKMVNNNLAKINSNISEMLIESFKGIDLICSKVRDCISDFHPAEPPTPTFVPQPPTYTESFADDIQTQKMLAKRKEQADRPKTPKYIDITSRYEEYQSKTQNKVKPQHQEANLFEETDESETEMKDKSKDKYRSEDRSQIDKTPYMERNKCKEEKARSEESIQYEISCYEERPRFDESLEVEVAESCCLIESVDSLDKRNFTDDTTIGDDLDQDSEMKTMVNLNKSEEKPDFFTEINYSGKGEDISEITELSFNENTASMEPKKNRKAKKTKSKHRMERKKKQRRKNSLEEYTQAVKKEVDNADFNSLQAIIQNLTERIDLLSSQSMDIICDKEKKDNKKKVPSKVSTRASSIIESSTPLEVTLTIEDDKPVSKSRSIRDLLGSALTRALAAKKTLPVKHGKPRLNLTEVYHRPGVTNLHKRLLTQMEANDSFLCFQRLMAKHKVDNFNQNMFSRINIPLSISNSIAALKNEEFKSRSFIRSEQKSQEYQGNHYQETQSQKSDLRSKYADSLWFNEKKMYKDKSSKTYHNHHTKEKKSRSIKAMSNYSSATIGTECTDRSNTTELKKHTPICPKPSQCKTKNYKIPKSQLSDAKKSKRENSNPKTRPYSSNMSLWFNKKKQKAQKKDKMFEKKETKVKDKKFTDKAETEKKITNQHKSKSNYSLPTVKYRKKCVKTESRASYNLRTILNHSLSNVYSIGTRISRHRPHTYNKPVPHRTKSSTTSTFKSKSSTDHNFKSMSSLNSTIKSKSSIDSKLKTKPNAGSNRSKSSIGSTKSKLSITSSKSKASLSSSKSKPSISNSKSKPNMMNASSTSNSINIRTKAKEHISLKRMSSLMRVLVNRASRSSLPCKQKTICRCGISVNNDTKESKTTVKTRVHWMRPKNDTHMPMRKLEYLDILDDLTHKDLLPLRSEYPRRDLMVDEKLGLKQNRDIKDTYLWQMMYGKEKNDTIWSHLLQPNIDCMDRACHFCERHEKDKWMHVDDRLRPNRDLCTRSALFDLSEKGAKKVKGDKSGLFDDSEKVIKSVKQKSKRKAIEKLMPYLFDPKEEKNNQTLIVMPVRVFYNNPPPVKIIEDNSEICDISPVSNPKIVKKAKLPKYELPAMKEAKLINRAKWSRPTTPGKSKRKMAGFQKEGIAASKNIKLFNANPENFDESYKEREKNQTSKKFSNSFISKHYPLYTPTYDPTTTEKLTHQQTAYKKAIMRNLNRLMTIREKEKKERQLTAVKDGSASLPQKVPHYAQPTIQSRNYFQKANNQNQDQKIEGEKKNNDTINSSRKPMDIKPAIDRKLSPKLNEYDKNITENKSDFDRKMLSFKYGKSVGEQLVSFLNNQPPSPDLLITPTPPNPMHMSKFGGTMGSRYPTMNMNRGDNAKNNHLLGPPHKSASMRHRQMLMHLRGLKQKNNQIQSNIQKAITVIETKMVDILSAPGDSASVEAFDIMEKEITKVLSMMKMEGLESSDNRGKGPLLEDEFELISKELFSKLEKILDSECSKDPTSASESDGRDSARSSAEVKKLSNRSDRQLSSSLTTISQDENYSTPTRNLKQKTKKISRVRSDTKLMDVKYSPAEKDMSSAAENEFAMGENITGNESIGEHIYDQKEDIDKQQGDQPSKQNINAKKPDQPESDLDVIWDTAEQLERLEKILQESTNEKIVNVSNSNDPFEDALQREQEKDILVQRLKATDTFRCAIEEEDEEESKDQLAFLNSRINLLLESPCKVEVPTVHPTQESPISDNNIKNHQPICIHKNEEIVSPRDSQSPSPCHESLSVSPRKDDQPPYRNDISTSPGSTSPSQSPRRDDSSATPSRETFSPHVYSTCPGSDEMMSSSVEEFVTPTQVTLCADDKILIPQIPILPDLDGNSIDCSDQVNKIIKRVEDIYAQLDDFQTSNDEQLIPVFTDAKNVPAVPSEEFLTPFMQAVRNKRTKQSKDSTHSSALETTPSYYNILHFLDTLNEIETENVQEVHTARLYKCAYAYDMPTVLHQATIEYPIQCSLADKPSCLKKYDDSKNKKKVSFLVLKENKCAQTSNSPIRKVKHNKKSQDHISGDDPKSVSEEDQNVNNSKNIQVSNAESSEGTEKTDSEESYFSTQTTLHLQSPRPQVYYNTSEESIPDVINKRDQIKGCYGTPITNIKNRTNKMKKQIVIFKEISSISDLLQRPKNLKEFSPPMNMQLISPTRNSLMNLKENNVVFLKSFYAFMYLLVFTALNMEYKCY